MTEILPIRSKTPQKPIAVNVYSVLFYHRRGNPDEVPFRRGGKCTNCTLGYSCDAAAEGLCYTPC